MKQRRTTLSVIMACHNSASFLDEAIASVLNQTLRDLELILVDDSSTDNSLEIARSYEEQDDRVSVLSAPASSGPGPARNAGISVARGEWLAILDSDDVALPSRFADQMQMAKSEPNLVLIGSNSIMIDENGRALREHVFPTNHRQLAKRLRTYRGFPPHSSIVYRGDIVRRLAAFDAKYFQSEDRDLWLRLSEVGKLASVNKPLAKIRKHKGNVSNLDGGKVALRLAYAAIICHFLRRHGSPDPSATGDQAQWQAFLAWVEKRMAEEGVFERHETKGEIRLAYLATDNRLLGALRLGAQLLRSGSAPALIRDEIRGTRFPKRLADEWKANRLQHR